MVLHIIGMVAQTQLLVALEIKKSVAYLLLEKGLELNPQHL